MRKTIKDKEGNETVYEGTPEELADLERRLREESPTKVVGRKRLLKEEESRQMLEKILAEVEKVNKNMMPPWFSNPHGLCTCPICCPNKPIWIIPDVLQPPVSPWPGYPLPYIGDPIEPGRWTITTTSDTIPGSATYGYNPSSSELKIES